MRIKVVLMVFQSALDRKLIIPFLKHGNGHILKFTSQHHALCPFVFGLRAKILKHTDHSSSNKPVSQNLSGVSKTSGTNPRRPVIWLEGPYSTVPGRFILPLFRRGMRDTLQCSAVLLSFIVTFLHSFSLSCY